MALVIPKSVGGNADAFDDAPAVQPIEERASNLVIPAEVGGEKLAVPPITRQVSVGEINQGIGPFDAAMISAGRSITNIGRAFGIAEDEDPATRAAFKELAKENPISTTLGEALPFIAPGVGVGAIPGIVTRIIASTGLGALEGGIIAEGRDESVLKGAGVGGSIGGIVEAVFPVVGRISSALFTRVTGRAPKGALLTPDGAPTPDLQNALDQGGVSFDSLVDEAITELKQAPIGTDPQQAVRSARFKSQGIPATTGDITQDFRSQSSEARLVGMATGEGGEPLRQLRLDQSEAFKDSINSLVDSLGVPPSTGDSIKSALSGRKKLLKAQKNKLYKEAAENAPEIRNLPLFTDEISAAIPDARTARRIGRLVPGQAGAVDDLLVEFGIKQLDEAAQEAIEVTPLSLDNLEDFRSAINAIERSDQTHTINVLTGPIKSALDEEADVIAKGLQAAGIVDEDILAPLKAARKAVRQIKTEFSPQSITGKMIDVKRDGVTPIIEASKVADTLLSPSAPIENLQKTLSSLSKSGKNGKKAIGDLQASVIMRALDDALKAPSRKTSGIETIGGNQFAKSLSKFGDDKLDLLFKGNPKALERLRGLQQTAKDITPSSAATPKGSAPIILDALNRAGSIPGLAAIRDLVKFVVSAGSDERAVRRALNAKPVFKRIAGELQKDFPALLSSIGIASTAQAQEE